MNTGDFILGIWFGIMIMVGAMFLVDLVSGYEIVKIVT